MTMPGVSPTGLSGSIVDNVFYFILAICVFLLALITFLMVYFIIRYRKEKNPYPKNIEGNIWLEVTWTIAPTLLVLAMFYYGLTGFQFLRKVPQGAMVINVIARQWSWLFQYESGIQETQLRVPVAKPIKLLITARDVIHSFYVPALRIKQDAVPGMQTYLWFQATEPGTFDILCAQYCGLGHANMHTQLVVLKEDEFKKWYESKTKEMAKAPVSGGELYKEKGCVSCHSTDGSEIVGPSFKGLIGRAERVIRNGMEVTLKVDEAYVRYYILHPNVDIIKGYRPIMPHIPMTSDELDVIVKWLDTLK
jgi:cytochrome c oxidase subunit 2